MKYIIRQAKKEDSYALAKMVNQAGQGPDTRGLDLSEWSLTAATGQDPFEVGQKIIEKEDGTYSYTNMRVLEVDGENAAMAMCFEAWTRTPEEISQIPEDFRVFKFLTNTIPGKFYLDSLAVNPKFRGQGFGQIMLDDCIKLAKEQHYDAVYLIAFEKNAAGVGLYKKNSFKEVLSLPNSKHPDMPYQDGKVLLFKKDI